MRSGRQRLHRNLLVARAGWSETPVVTTLHGSARSNVGARSAHTAWAKLSVGYLVFDCRRTRTRWQSHESFLSGAGVARDERWCFEQTDGTILHDTRCTSG
jgi:hypothetical protein